MLKDIQRLLIQVLFSEDPMETEPDAQFPSEESRKFQRWIQTSQHFSE